MLQIIGRVRIWGDPPPPPETTLKHIATSRYRETCKNMYFFRISKLLRNILFYALNYRPGENLGRTPEPTLKGLYSVTKRG